MGYCRGNPGGDPYSASLTDLGVLRPEGTPEDQQDEGLGRIGGRGRRRLSRGGRAFGAGAAVRRARARALARRTGATSTARRSLALRMGRGAPEEDGQRMPRRQGRRARQRAYVRMKRERAAGRTTTTARRRRGGIGGMVGRMRERARTARARQQAADAERVAAEALQIAEAERLARESVTGRPEVTNGAVWRPPPVTDRGGWGRPRRPPPMVGTMQACVGSPPDRRRGWECFSGQWRYRSPWAPTGPVPSLPERPPQNGLEVPKIPTARPWWQGAAPEGEIPLRDTSGIPTPPGLPGGPSMRPPASGPDDTATERVGAPAPAAAGMDMAKILPLVAGAALLFMNK